MSAEGAIGSFKIHYLSHWGHVLNEEENLKEYSLLLLLLFWLIHYTDIWVCVSFLFIQIYTEGLKFEICIETTNF